MIIHHHTLAKTPAPIGAFAIAVDITDSQQVLNPTSLPVRNNVVRNGVDFSLRNIAVNGNQMVTDMMPAVAYKRQRLFQKCDKPLR
jgi:hypothetical protein